MFVRAVPPECPLYSAALRWHFSRVRFSRPLSFACALFCAACASPLEKAERAERSENTRVVESRRMRALDYGDANSERGAELLVVDKYKAFNLASAATGSTKSYSTGSAQMKEFNYEQKVTTKSYASRGFWGAKQSALSGQRYATEAARTTGNYEIPNATKKADTKTAATKEARESNKTLATGGLHDGNRQFLGKESKRMNRTVDPNKPVGWEGDLKEMSIADLRELLNKNK